MKIIDYKGFTILSAPTCNACTTGVDIVTRYHVSSAGLSGAGFNPDGYATLGNAKGAITKHLQAQHLRAATAVKAPSREAMIQGARDFAAAMFKPSAKPVLQSRNKREGVFVGVMNGKHQRVEGRNRDFPVLWSSSHGTKTRKQRKEQKLIDRLEDAYEASMGM